jgi:hypothetical protein
LGGVVFRSNDFDRNVIWTGVYHFGFIRFLNYYSVNWDYAYNPETVNNRRTRGGPLTLNPPGWQTDLSVSSDSRKNIVFNAADGTYQSDDETF